MKNTISFYNNPLQPAETILFPTSLFHLLEMLHSEISTALVSKIKHIVIEGDLACMISSLGDLEETSHLILDKPNVIHKFLWWLKNAYDSRQYCHLLPEEVNEKASEGGAFMYFDGYVSNYHTFELISLLTNAHQRMFRQLAAMNLTCIGTQFITDSTTDRDGDITSYFYMHGFWLTEQLIHELGCAFDELYAIKQQARIAEEEIAELERQLADKKAALATAEAIIRENQ